MKRHPTIRRKANKDVMMDLIAKLRRLLQELGDDRAILRRPSLKLDILSDARLTLAEIEIEALHPSGPYA